MKLTEEEAAKLAELQAKAEAPDEEPAGGPGRVVNYHVDLGDEKQVGLARKLGFLPADEPEGEGGEEGGGESDEEEEAEEEPTRRGFFDK